MSSTNCVSNANFPALPRIDKACAIKSYRKSGWKYFGVQHMERAAAVYCTEHWNTLCPSFPFVCRPLCRFCVLSSMHLPKKARWSFCQRCVKSNLFVKSGKEVRCASQGECKKWIKFQLETFAGGKIIGVIHGKNVSKCSKNRKNHMKLLKS